MQDKPVIIGHEAMNMHALRHRVESVGIINPPPVDQEVLLQTLMGTVEAIAIKKDDHGEHILSSWPVEGKTTIDIPEETTHFKITRTELPELTGKSAAEFRQDHIRGMQADAKRSAARKDRKKQRNHKKRFN